MKKEKRTYQTEDQKEMQKFFLVLIALIGIILGVYFLSKVLIKPDVKDYEYTSGTISTTAISVGTIFTAPEKEYYVLAYDTKGIDAQSYVTYAGYYSQNKEKAIKIYYLDLSNGLNKEFYVTEKSNPKATKVSELKIKDGTLLKIKNGKIEKYMEGNEKIASELKVK